MLASPRRAACLALLATLACPCIGVQIVTENPPAFAAADPNDPKYIIALFDDAAKARADPTHPAERSVVMTQADGAQYNCTLPGPRPPSSTVVTTPQAEGSGEFALPQKTPQQLLDALTAMCLYHREGLWTYEFCYRKHVRQFRQRSSGGVEEFSCGIFDMFDGREEVEQVDFSPSGHPYNYVRQTFSGGHYCTLNGEQRKSEVRFLCAPGQSENVITLVKEFPTCSYVINVATPFLCQHPRYRPKESPLRVIACAPLGEGGAVEGGPGAPQPPRTRQQPEDSSGAAEAPAPPGERDQEQRTSAASQEEEGGGGGAEAGGASGGEAAAPVDEDGGDGPRQEL